MKTSRLLRSPLLMLVGVLALFLSAGPGSLSAQTDTETKIRLMADALRARDSGDLVAAEDSLRQLAAMAPGDATLHRLLESIISLLDAGPASAYVASAAFDFDDEAEALARAETGLRIVTEVLGEHDVDLVAGTADILQIGARNAQNFQLLIACARSGKPVLLKRGMSMRIEEWLLAAEYLLAHGNPNVILCERGIRTFENYTRNTLDLAAVAIAKQETHLPVIVDPSQGCGRADLVKVLCRGAAAVGADGLIVEVHPNPAEALSDGQQQLDPASFAQLVDGLRPFVAAAGRSL